MQRDFPHSFCVLTNFQHQVRLWTSGTTNCSVTECVWKCLSNSSRKSLITLCFAATYSLLLTSAVSTASLRQISYWNNSGSNPDGTDLDPNLHFRQRYNKGIIVNCSPGHCEHLFLLKNVLFGLYTPHKTYKYYVIHWSELQIWNFTTNSNLLMIIDFIQNRTVVRLVLWDGKWLNEFCHIVKLWSQLINMRCAEMSTTPVLCVDRLMN